MRECVVIDGVRSANARAHKDKGWFRNVRPEQLLIKVYQALFERNPKVKPEEVEAVFCGTANQAGMQNDIARLLVGRWFPGSGGVKRHQPAMPIGDGGNRTRGPRHHVLARATSISHRA